MGLALCDGRKTLSFFVGLRPRSPGQIAVEIHVQRNIRQRCEGRAAHLCLGESPVIELVLDRWVDLAVSVEKDGKATLYVDGVAVGSGTLPGAALRGARLCR